MGRKKSKRVQPKTRRVLEEKRFNCLMCNQEQAVKCTVDNSTNKGAARCEVCDATFHCDTNRLSQPIDVYSSWVDSKE